MGVFMKQSQINVIWQPLVGHAQHNWCKLTSDHLVDTHFELRGHLVGKTKSTLGHKHEA